VDCKRPGRLIQSELRALNIEPSRLEKDVNVMRPVGCDRCRHSGYKGRIGVFEVFEIDDEVRHLVSRRVSSALLRRRARELGMRSLREDGIRKVLAGFTSAEEIISVTIGDAS
jgi:general secretion pathway protein E/type IV pilus assembly protein PilB